MMFAYMYKTYNYVYICICTYISSVTLYYTLDFPRPCLLMFDALFITHGEQTSSTTHVETADFFEYGALLFCVSFKYQSFILLY